MMIQFLNVTKIYPSSPKAILALDDVSFEINQGEFVFLVGPSGSGKTTILRQIIREELPSAGKIFFEDEDISRLRRSGVYKLRRKIGIVFQDYKLLEHKNAYENVAFAMEAAGQSNKEIKETVPYVLDIVNLSHRANAFPTQLSGGEKQKVAIARAIANNPKLLIADEPTGNLDPESAWDIVQILAKINKWGTTIVMSTHGTDIVNSLQKRVLKLADGKLLRDDKKGVYEELDEYSMKILMQEEKKQTSKDKSQKAPVKSDASEKPSEETFSIPEVPGTLDTPDLPSVNSIATNEIIILGAPKPLGEATIDLSLEVVSASESQAEAVVEVLAKADTVNLQVLKLTNKLTDKLAELGYLDVEDILKAGVGTVNEKLNKTEIRQLAKAIKRYLTTE